MLAILFCFLTGVRYSAHFGTWCVAPPTGNGLRTDPWKILACKRRPRPLRNYECYWHRSLAGELPMVSSCQSPNIATRIFWFVMFRPVEGLSICGHPWVLFHLWSRQWTTSRPRSEQKLQTLAWRGTPCSEVFASQRRINRLSTESLGRLLLRWLRERSYFSSFERSNF